MDAQLIDIAWMAVCAALVLLMQPGFMCLESGLTRSKNSINVAIKNITDFAISVLVFWAIGFALMFGASKAGLFGTTLFFAPVSETPVSSSGAWLAAFFLFQAMFCGTATTIVSGAVAERMRFSGYLIISVVLSGFTYPIFGHWAWAGTYGDGSGWLRALGFVDFAGSTVVHSVGGWVALAVVLVIGPRAGRFPKDEPPRTIPGQNVPRAVLGVLLLWLGWFGFNGGSTLAMNYLVTPVIANTMLSGAAGLIAGLLVGWPIRGRPDIDLVMNGSLAGLVAITASCHAVSASSAVMIGSVGAVVMLAMTALLERLRIDDVVGAIPVHAGAGAWGTLAVALFGKADALDSGLNFLPQLGAQVLGVAVCFAWSFGLVYLLTRAANRFWPLRVTPDDEEIGLNVAEHGATTEILDLLTVMDTQSQTGDLSVRVPVEPFTEIGQIATLYNRVMDALETHAAELQRSNRDLEQFAYVASHDLQEPLRAVAGYCQLIEHGYQEKLDGEGKELIAGAVSGAKRMQTLIQDLLTYSRVGRSEEAFVPCDCAILVEQAMARLQTVIEETGALVDHADLPTITVDTSQATQLFQNLISNAIKYCDHERPAIHIEAQPRDDQWLFSVRDNGIGIDPQHRERVFVIFQRLHTRDQYSGTGIGLAICKRIVNRHGGQIWLESELGKGSVFYFTLPMSGRAIR